MIPHSLQRAVAILAVALAALVAAGQAWHPHAVAETDHDQRVVARVDPAAPDKPLVQIRRSVNSIQPVCWACILHTSPPRPAVAKILPAVPASTVQTLPPCDQAVARSFHLPPSGARAPPSLVS